MSDRKTISFRLNLDDEADKKIYLRLQDEFSKYGTESSCIKAIVSNYFADIDNARKEQDFMTLQTEMQRQFQYEVCEIIKDEMAKEGMKLVGALLSGLGENARLDIPCSEKEEALPSATEEFPDNLNFLLNQYEN